MFKWDQTDHKDPADVHHVESRCLGWVDVCLWTHLIFWIGFKKSNISLVSNVGVRLFARRTFTTPKIRTFTTPKLGHFPPPQKKHLPGGQLPPPIFFSVFWRTFLGFFDLQLMEDIKDGKEEVLDEVVMEHIK